MATEDKEKSNETISENQAVKEATAIIMNARSAVGTPEENWVLSDAKQRLSNTAFRTILALAVIDRRASIVIENELKQPSTKHLSFDKLKMMEAAVLEYSLIKDQFNNGIDRSYADNIGDKVMLAIGTLDKKEALNLYQNVMRSFPHHYREQAGNAINDIIPKFSCSEGDVNGHWIEAKQSTQRANLGDTIRVPKTAAFIKFLTTSKDQPKPN